MKVLVAIFFVFVYNIPTLAQSDPDPKKSTVNLDLLTAPVSPAANLLGFATSDIQKPTELSDFILSLQTNSSNFTALPTNYTVDIAPFWILKAKGLTIDKYNSRDFGDVFKQSFAFSAGIRTVDSTHKDLNYQNLYNSYGLKFSLVRGKLTRETLDLLDTINKRQGEISQILAEKINAKTKKDSTYGARMNIARELFKKYAREGKDAEKYKDYQDAMKKVDERFDELQKIVETEGKIPALISDLDKMAARFKIKRTGFFMDFAGGTSIEFDDKNFNDANIYNGGGWLTFGYEGAAVSFLGLARYLYNPTKIFADDAGTIKTANLSTLDGGARIILSTKESRFKFSSEAIYRSVLNENVLDPSWRFILNAEYDIGNNQLLTFSFGRDFDGTVSKDGTVIAALNFLKGFGNQRK